MSGDSPAPTPPKLPGDRAHLERLIDTWAREPTVKATAGRLRNVVSSLVVVGMIEGVVDDQGDARIALKGDRQSPAPYCEARAATRAFSGIRPRGRTFGVEAGSPRSRRR